MKLKYLATAIAPLAIGFAAPANAQVPVIDPANVTQTIKVVQSSVAQVQQLKAQVEQMTSMAKTIGSNGPLAIATDLLKKAGMDFANSANSPLAPYRAAMPGLLDALPGAEAGKGLGIADGLAEKAKTSIQSGREFALKAFYKPGDATTAELQQRQGIREAAMRDSVTAGYAMAVYTKNSLGDKEKGIEHTMSELSKGVSAAGDLRGDVQSNSAIALAQLQQISVQNQMLAQLLEVQATSSMANRQSGVR
jgi:hypothetical protein